MGKKHYVIEDFTRDSLEKLCDSTQERLCVWSPSEIRLMGRYNPALITDINDSLGTTYSYDSRGFRVLAISEAVHQACTLDNAVFFGGINAKRLRRKVYLIEKACNHISKKAIITESDVTEDNVLDSVYHTKTTALDILDECGSGETRPMKTVQGYPFVEAFRELLGDSLNNIILYGSSARGEGNDYDLVLLVDRVESWMYDRLFNKARSIESDKQLGIVLWPSSSLLSYNLHASAEASLHNETKLVYGPSLEAPVIRGKEKADNHLSRVGTELNRLRNTLGNIELQEKLLTMKALRRYTFKLEIWIRRALLEAEQGRYFTKEEAMEVEGINIKEFGPSPTPEEVRAELIDANMRVKEKVDWLYDKTRRKAPVSKSLYISSV